MKRTVALIVLDGWGIGDENLSNPIHVVNPPTFAKLAEEYPLTSLQASGISVGLPWDEVGNSEVGHVTLGSGRVTYQSYPRITLAVRDGSFFKNPALTTAMNHAAQNGSAVNLVGLLSSGNIHSSLEHLLALVKMSETAGVPVKLHLFADGKDSAPKSLSKLLERVPKALVSTLVGRYYAMDRTQNWTLIQKTYDALVRRNTALTPDYDPLLQETYASNGSEEFLPPVALTPEGINSNDAVIFFNFRKDSIYELAQSFIDPKFAAFGRAPLENLCAVTMTSYDEAWQAPAAFPPEYITHPLGKVLADAGKSQLRIAETYKYGHVTFFFNGYANDPFPGEYRVLIPSLSGPHPDEHPELMADAITDRVLAGFHDGAFDFMLVNYSNPDTIAHTGNYNAALEAVRVMDREMARLVEAAEKSDAILVITSDHGNIEKTTNPLTGAAQREHKTSPVPLYIVGREFKGKKFLGSGDLREFTMGIISDVAPTILAIMGIQKPQEMTGQNLLDQLV